MTRFIGLIFVFFSIFYPDKIMDRSTSTVQVMAYMMPPADINQIDQLPLNKLTHIIFSFTEVIDNKMKFKDENTNAFLQRLVSMKEKYPRLKVMVACGGWGGSGGFSNMAAAPQTRQLFVKSVIEFIKAFKLDGLDMDWEYPGLKGIGNHHLPEDKVNFTALMKELREAMDATGKQLTLTFASAGWVKYYDNIELLQVMKYADYMNVMTYDLAGGGSPLTAHHSNLEHIDITNPKYAFLLKGPDSMQIKNRDRASAKRIVDFCLLQGVNSRQIIIGAAFYGRTWGGVNPTNNGLFQSHNSSWTGAVSYQQISEEYENKNGYVRYWDKDSKAPFLYNKKDSLFITYDDTMSVRLKTQFVKDMKLGGVMFWQLGSDSKNYDLLNAIK